MASKRLERRKDKFKFTATDVEADQYSMMTQPDHWFEQKYVLLQIPVFNCLHCFHPFSGHLCEYQQLCSRVFVGNYTQSERRTCRFLRLLKSQFCFVLCFFLAVLSFFTCCTHFGFGLNYGDMDDDQIKQEERTLNICNLILLSSIVVFIGVIAMVLGAAVS